MSSESGKKRYKNLIHSMPGKKLRVKINKTGLNKCKKKTEPIRNKLKKLERVVIYL